METKKFKQTDQEQLVNAEGHRDQAVQISKSMTLEEYQFMRELCPKGVATSPDQMLRLKLHCSVFSKTKRIIDLSGALVGLFLSALIFIPVTLAMQLDSPGPIFYHQVRCGVGGKLFRIWKFRSMIVNAEAQQHLVVNEVEGNIFKNKNDPRITRVGRFLRRTSLDEFPQFWNVFKGEMSLVGTRPPTPSEVKNYSSHHYRRLLVKPGMTGEWQANGRSEINNFEDIVRMDLEYQRKWSITYDLQLILKTIRGVLLSRGAC